MDLTSMETATSMAELKRAYRKLAFENHPDRGGSEEIMKQINASFQIHFERMKSKKEQTAADSEDFGSAKTAREYTDFVYNEYRWEGCNFKGNFDLSDICKKIKDYGKQKFPTCKFSVSKDGYRTIRISLMQGDFEAYTEDNTENHRGFNHYHDECNGHLTPRCQEVLRLMTRYAQSYNYDNSDIMTDYFDVNFYLQVEVGKWNTAYVNTSKVVAGEKLAKTPTEKLIQKLVGTGNWVYKVTSRKGEFYCICKRGDKPYANWYSQYSVAKRKIENLRLHGVECEWYGSAIKINNWDRFEAQIAKEQAEMIAKPKPVVEKREKTQGKVDIVDYNEASFVVVGDTYPIRAQLKELGGKFNKFLRCGAGWVFSKKNLSEVQAALA